MTVKYTPTKNCEIRFVYVYVFINEVEVSMLFEVSDNIPCPVASQKQMYMYCVTNP